MAPGKTNSFPLTGNFNLREFQCSCCGQVKLHPLLVEQLQQLRDKVQQPVVITSGYRCPDHNRQVGGAAESYHIRGLAADVRVAGTSPRRVARLADSLGFNGIGLYETFVHLDLRPRKARW